jgi:hypothetical protein
MLASVALALVSRGFCFVSVTPPLVSGAHTPRWTWLAALLYPLQDMKLHLYDIGLMCIHKQYLISITETDASLA